MTKFNIFEKNFFKFSTPRGYLEFTSALILLTQFFFSFLKLFTYMSIHFRFNQSNHHNGHKISHLLMYNMSGVVDFAKRFDVILMCMMVDT